jgi:hypothetical protein
VGALIRTVDQKPKAKGGNFKKNALISDYQSLGSKNFNLKRKI